MSRNWGITSGTDLRGNEHRPRSIAPGTQRDNVIQLADHIPPDRLNSRSKEGEPFIDPFEIGSCFVFAAVILLPITIVSGVVIGYLAFVA